MVVILPNVETFSLYMRDNPAAQAYDIAGHISCPRARDTSLGQEIRDYNVGDDPEIFPYLVLWNKIVHQHTTCPMEEATLEVKRNKFDGIRCSLTFQSANAAVLKLGFDVAESGESEEELGVTFKEMGWEIFSQALATIRDYPLLSHIEQLHIKHRSAALDVHRWAEEVGDLFNRLRPLDKLTIDGCDLQIFLPGFLDDPDFRDLEEVITFPWIKEIAILCPDMCCGEGEGAEAIVRLAKSQHELGIPFERVAVRTWNFPTGMVEELGRWANAVEYFEVEWWQQYPQY